MVKSRSFILEKMVKVWAITDHVLVPRRTAWTTRA